MESASSPVMLLPTGSKNLDLDGCLASVLRALARERVLRQDDGSRPAGHGPMDTGAATEALSLKPLLGFWCVARCALPTARGRELQLVGRGGPSRQPEGTQSAGQLPRQEHRT